MTDPTTKLLTRISRGDPEASEELLALVYTELREMAARAMRAERQNHTLQPTALVHEVLLKLGRGEDWEAESRGQFLGIAAHAMRQVLVDHARSKNAQKRGGDFDRHSLGEDLEVTSGEAFDVLALNEAIDALNTLDPRLRRIVELKFFCGLENREVAEAMNESLRSTERGWRAAKDFLRERLDS